MRLMWFALKKPLGMNFVPRMSLQSTCVHCTVTLVYWEVLRGSGGTDKLRVSSLLSAAVQITAGLAEAEGRLGSQQLRVPAKRFCFGLPSAAGPAVVCLCC